MKHDHGPTEEVIRQAFLNAYPNPERIECPSDTVLKALSQDRSADTQELTAHMSRCSPSTREYLEFRTAWRKRRNRGVALAAAGFGGVAAAILIWLFLAIGRQAAPGGSAPSNAPLVAVLDYREGTTRGVEKRWPSAMVSSKTTELRIYCRAEVKVGRIQ